MKYKKWIMKSGDTAAEKRLRDDGVSSLAAKVLSARKIRTRERVDELFSVSPSRLGDPLGLQDMEEATERIRKALHGNEKIAVYGDYDVDGIMAVTLLVEWLRTKNADCVYYIPERMEEGYGLTDTAIKRLAEDGVTLIVTVDTGITAAAEVRFASDIGVDIIITDHHDCPDELPPAVAIVNPQRSENPSVFHFYAGVGVAFMLALAFDGKDNAEQLISAYSDLVAIGTIADVVPMIEDNRVLTAHGLQSITHTKRAGLKALVSESVQDGKRINEAIIGYSLAPRINAAGRMGRADDAVELFLQNDYAEAEKGAKHLCELNRLRRKIENDVQNEIDAQAEQIMSEYDGGEPPAALVLSSDGWHQGVVGIVASRLSERYACPVFLICVENGMGKGSARSFYGINILHIMRRVAHLFESWGGHEYAAGFTIREENIPVFREILMELSHTLSPAHIEIDAEIPATELEPDEVEGLRFLEPYGPINTPPLFLLKNIVISDIVALGGGKSARLTVTADGRSMNAVYFSHEKTLPDICEGDICDIAFHAETEIRNGRKEVLLLILEARPPLETARRAEREIELWERFTDGQDITPPEARTLLPKKRDFVAVLRHLKRNYCDGSYSAHLSAFCRRVCREENLEEGYARMLICLSALDEKRRLLYTRSGDVLNITLSDEKPVDLNSSQVLGRLHGIIQSEGVCGDDGQCS